MKLDARNKIEIGLIVVAMAAWFLRKAKVIYIPGLTAFALGIAMGLLGMGFIAQKDKSKKLAGILVLAFGLFNVFVGIMEIVAVRNGVA